MDVEIEEVAKILFSDEIPEAWKDNEEFSEYIIQLSSCGVEKLGKEGVHLKEELLAILDQTRDLAYSNYKTFIHTADCSRTIYKDFTSVEDHLEGLSSCLPSLRESVDQFLATSRNLSQSRHLTSLTLTKHTQLLEILELPQLMDTCVRNGYYDEALEILAYVRRLERKHTDIPIIAAIVTEIQAGTRLMLNQLLAQLRSPLALPQCLKVIGLLRRLDVFTEPELRLKFLQARDTWFNGILKGIPKEDPYQHIIKVIETSRVHLFDIVTQYRAIFSDDDTRFSLGDPDVNEQAIFHGWILHKVNHFLKMIEKDLESGVGPNLESIMAQAMFFGQSFSRIGADFRNLLIPLFQKAALAQCEKNIRVANIKFDETLSSFSLMEASHMSAPSTFMTEIQDKTRPPLTLMEFPPLAHYMNGLVAAFNTLRQCCPVATLPEVINLLNQSLSKVIGALLELHRLESSGFTAKEEASFQRLCSVVASGVLPHLNSCLRMLYPLQHIALITGVPTTQLHRENFGQLDVDKLLEPLVHLIPKKEEREEYLDKNDLTTLEDETTASGEISTVANIELDKDEIIQTRLLPKEMPIIEEMLNDEDKTDIKDKLDSECEDTDFYQQELNTESDKSNIPVSDTDFDQQELNTESDKSNIPVSELEAQEEYELHNEADENSSNIEATIPKPDCELHKELDENLSNIELITKSDSESQLTQNLSSVPKFELANESEESENEESKNMFYIPLE